MYSRGLPACSAFSFLHKKDIALCRLLLLCLPAETIKCVMFEGAMNIFKKAVQKMREKLQHRCLGNA